MFLSAAKTRGEARIEIKVSHILNLLSRKRANITITILSGQSSFWRRIGSLFQLTSKQFDYCIVSSKNIGLWGWWYALFIQAKSIYVLEKRQRIKNNVSFWVFQWILNRYNLIITLNKQNHAATFYDNIQSSLFPMNTVR